MKLALRISFLITIFISLFCCDSTTKSKNDNESNSNINILGELNKKRIFNYQISRIKKENGLPLILPPDSIKHLIDFPDSLYNAGIFIYGERTYCTTQKEDTIIIDITENGKNLYSEIMDELQGISSTGVWGINDQKKYIIKDSEILNVTFDNHIMKEYDIPLEIGKVWDTDFFGINLIEVEKDTLFNIYKGNELVYKLNFSGYRTEQRYISPDIGLVKKISMNEESDYFLDPSDSHLIIYKVVEVLKTIEE